MNQRLTQYVDSLFSALPSSPEAADLREEILANLNDRYEDELARGLDENAAYRAAIDGLGDIQEALNGLPGAAPAYSAGPRPGAAQRPQSALLWVLAALALAALLLVGAVVAGFTFYRGAAASPVQTSRVIVSAAQTPAETDLPAPASQPASGMLDGLCAQSEYAAADLQGLELELTLENTIFSTWEGSTIKVEVWFYGPAQLAPALTFEGNTVRVVSPKNVILDPFASPRGEVKIYLPEGYSLPFADLASTSGTINAAALEIAELAAATTSGNIQISLAGTAGKIALASTSGTLDFSGDCDSLALSSTSGNITASGRFAKQAEASALSGTIELQGSGGTLNVGTTSGNVELAGDFESVTYQSTSGGLEAELALPTQDCRFQSTSGSMRLTLPQNDGFSLRYTTTSGQLRNAFTGHSGKGQGTDAYGFGGPLLQISTTSGSVSIAQK